MNNLKKFEIWSAVLTIILGSLLHFVFEWSGGWKPLALIAAVNESTWEHLKMAFWPAFIFSTIAYFNFARDAKQFFLAQAAKLFLMPFLIVILFYGWLLFFEESFIWDISIFVLSILVAHYIAYRLEISAKEYSLKIPSIILIGLLFISFSLLAYMPVKAELWREPTTGGYGILSLIPTSTESVSADQTEIHQDVPEDLVEVINIEDKAVEIQPLPKTKAPEATAPSSTVNSVGIVAPPLGELPERNEPDILTIPIVVEIKSSDDSVTLGQSITLTANMPEIFTEVIKTVDWTGQGEFENKTINGRTVSVNWKITEDIFTKVNIELVVKGEKQTVKGFKTINIQPEITGEAVKIN